MTQTPKVAIATPPASRLPLSFSQPASLSQARPPTWTIAGLRFAHRQAWTCPSSQRPVAPYLAGQTAPICSCLPSLPLARSRLPPLTRHGRFSFQFNRPFGKDPILHCSSYLPCCPKLPIGNSRPPTLSRLPFHCFSPLAPTSSPGLHSRSPSISYLNQHHILLLPSLSPPSTSPGSLSFQRWRHHPCHRRLSTTRTSLPLSRSSLPATFYLIPIAPRRL